VQGLHVVARRGHHALDLVVLAFGERQPQRVAASPGSASPLNATPTPAGFGTVASAQGVGAPRALPATPQLRQVPERIERLPLRLGWSVAAGAAAYRAQVFDAANADRLMLDGLFDDTGARWSDDLPDGRYVLRVRAVDGNGLEGFDAAMPFTLKARPEPPFTTRPRAGERTADEAVLFAWTKSASAARYRLQVADTPEFAAPRVDQADIAGEELRVPLPVGTHHWRLASIRADGDTGPWGDPLSVTRVALPPPPASSPSQTTREGVLLSWRESAGARYQLQVARDAAFTTLLHDERVEVAQWLLRSPAPGSYFVRVRTIDADGFVGPFGAVQQVDVRWFEWWMLLVPALLLLL
jgi:hypothetical protein